MPFNLKVLAIDIGGTNVKVLATGQKERRKFPSGPKMTPREMVARVKKLVADWDYDVIAIGYPGQVHGNRPISEPRNLGKGWRRFNFRAAFKHPVKMINDAAMQALGSYRKGTMLFLGLGTGLGSALVVEGTMVPMELAHLNFKKGTYEDYLGARGLKRLGRRKWQMQLEKCLERIIQAFQLDEVVIGGGNAKKLTSLPKCCRIGDNANAFLGGFRLWDKPAPRAPRRNKQLLSHPRRTPPRSAAAQRTGLRTTQGPAPQPTVANHQTPISFAKPSDASA